jgi:hypothetical protein
MPRGRNSKSAVLKDNARERRVRDQAALSLDAAANVIREWFTGEDELTGQLDYLAGKIRAGQADHTDHLVR